MLTRSELKAVLFDLDGTLVDTAPDLAVAVDTMLEQLALPRCGEEKVRDWVGDGIEALINRSLSDAYNGQISEDLLTRARSFFHAAYKANLSGLSRVYPGVIDGLSQLQSRGIAMACVTNKQNAYVLPLLEDLGLEKYFSAVVGGDCASQKKPAAEPLLLAAQRLGVDITEAVMVGDSENDIKAARNAGCLSIGLPYGYNFGRDISTANPDRVVASIADIPALISVIDDAVSVVD